MNTLPQCRACSDLQERVTLWASSLQLQKMWSVLRSTQVTAVQKKEAEGECRVLAWREHLGATGSCVFLVEIDASNYQNTTAGGILIVQLTCGFSFGIHPPAR